jgi:hypothetical protein
MSGVQPGLRSRIKAAMPATTGDANDVPESFSRPGLTTRDGFSLASVVDTGA